jgi:MFS transporter, FSR family, fosmidomycin resistance protein
LQYPEQIIDYQNPKTTSVIPFLIVFGLCHALIDASSAFLILGIIDIEAHLIKYLVYYNALAFGLQVPFGYLLDKYLYPKYIAIVGVLSIIISFFFTNSPMLSVFFIGIGNALFHVSGGQVALSINSRKATIPGIYVAPGGIGLALGIYLSVSPTQFIQMLFLFLLLLMFIILSIIKIPTISITKRPLSSYNYLILIVLLLFLSISIRSVVGLAINFSWKTDFYLLVFLTIFIALGKVLGGVLADRYGWMKTGLFGLLLAAPLLSFGSINPILGITGICVFNFTMPITLIAISAILPGRAGFSFGISSLALFIGALPTLTHHLIWFKNEWLFFTIILISALSLYLALHLIFIKKLNA